MNDYLFTIKELSNSLGFIGAPLDDDDLVFAPLNGLKAGENWKSFATSIYVSKL